VAETVPFSIQPITNKAAGGVGTAYRLEPDGKKYSTPLQLAFRYEDGDVEGTVPEALSIAYQDAKGAWHAQDSVTLDQAAKTLTIPVTHFSDYSTFARLRLNPPKATVKVGQAIIIQLLVCAEQGFFDRLLSRPVSCEQQPPTGEAEWTLEGPGRIQVSEHAQRDQMIYVTYIAPATKPNPNTAKVKLKVKFYTWNQETGRRQIIEDTFESRITIVGQGYRATGHTADNYYSGTICSLEEPFTVNGSVINYKFHFTPGTPATTGTVTVSAAGMMVKAEGEPTYNVIGLDTDKPSIAVSGAVVGHSPVGSVTGSGIVYIDLVPLEGDECGG
jgi:hypothetical protein